MTRPRRRVKKRNDADDTDGEDTAGVEAAEEEMEKESEDDGAEPDTADDDDADHGVEMENSVTHSNQLRPEETQEPEKKDDRPRFQGELPAEIKAALERAQRELDIEGGSCWTCAG